MFRLISGIFGPSKKERKRIALVRQEEVKSIALMIQEAIEKDRLLSSASSPLKISGEGCTWYVILKPDASVHVKCRLQIGPLDFVAYSTDHLRMAHEVELAHRTLPILVLGVLEQFPEISNRWRLLFRICKMKD